MYSQKPKRRFNVDDDINTSSNSSSQQFCSQNQIKPQFSNNPKIYNQPDLLPNAKFQRTQFKPQPQPTTAIQQSDKLLLSTKYRYMLLMMRENDTLTVKRHVNPMTYLALLQTHKKDTGSKTFRLESLGSACATLIKLSQMLELSGVAFKTSTKMKFRRMTLNSGGPGAERTEVCKNMECMKIDMQFVETKENQWHLNPESTHQQSIQELKANYPTFYRSSQPQGSSGHQHQQQQQAPPKFQNFFESREKEKPYMNGFKMQAELQPCSFLRRYNDFDDSSQIAQNKNNLAGFNQSASQNNNTNINNNNYSEQLNQSEIANQGAPSTRRTYFHDSSDEEGNGQPYQCTYSDIEDSDQYDDMQGQE